MTRALASLALAVAIAACSPLKTFDNFVPKDGGSSKVAANIAYGPADRQKLNIYVPEGEDAATRLRPVVVFYYGGSWNSGTKDGYDFVGRALAAQGFVTVVPDYRLVPEVRYPAFVDDGAAAVRWAQDNSARFGGDPTCIVLAGHSAGAYIAAMLAMDERWLGEDRENVRGWVGLAGPYDFLPLDGPVTKDAFGNWPNPRETQPVTWAGNGDPAALLLTGEDDETVLPRNSTRIASLLQEQGVPASAKLYPGLGHVGIVTALSKPLRGKAPVLQDTAAFVKQTCGV